MGNFLSGHKPRRDTSSKITDTDRAILSLKTQRRRLEDQQKLLDQRIDRFAEVARELLREAKKERALLALRKKKMSEKQRQQLGDLLMNVEGVLSSIELAKQQGKVYGLLQRGTEALKQLQQQVTVDDVRRLVEDTAEARAYQEEVNTLLGQSLTGQDESEAVAELEQLEELQRTEEMAELPVAPRVPKASVEAAVAARQAQEAAESGTEGSTAEAEPRHLEEPLAAS